MRHIECCNVHLRSDSDPSEAPSSTSRGLANPFELRIVRLFSLYNFIYDAFSLIINSKHYLPRVESALAILGRVATRATIVSVLTVGHRSENMRTGRALNEFQERGLTAAEYANIKSKIWTKKTLWLVDSTMRLQNLEAAHRRKLHDCKTPEPRSIERNASSVDHT